MKCWSRSTLGVVVGIFNVAALVGIAIYLAFNLIELDTSNADNYLKRNEIAREKTVFSIIIAICLIMALIAGLFVVGIIKRLHKLMIPWLILSGISFLVQCSRFVFSFFGALFSGVNFSAVLIMLLVGVVTIGISVLILWPLFTLFGDIRKSNIEGPGKKLIGL